MAEPKKIKILHVVWSLKVAGAEKLAVDMVHALSRAEFSTIVCSVNEDGLLGERLRQDGYTVYHRAKKSGLDWSMVKWLREIIANEQVDVVHSHQYSPMVYTVLAAVANRKMNHIYTEHGRNYPEQRRWKRTLVNPVLARMINHIVSISESTRKSMIVYDHLPSAKIKVIHNGVDLNRVRGVAGLCEKRRELEVPEGYCVVGTAARFDEVKNLPMMLRAFQLVLNKRPQTLLMLAGTGVLEDYLMGLVRDLEIEKSVRFVGLRHDLPDLLRIFDVFLLSSFTEGVSITLLEAMANGVPAVVTDVGGNSEVVIDGDTGFLVPLGAEEQMAMRIVELLENSQLSETMSFRSRERVEKSFSFSRMMAEYSAIYGVDTQCIVTSSVPEPGVTTHA